MSIPYRKSSMCRGHIPEDSGVFKEIKEGKCGKTTVRKKESSME